MEKNYTTTNTLWISTPPKRLLPALPIAPIETFLIKNTQNKPKNEKPKKRKYCRKKKLPFREEVTKTMDVLVDNLRILLEGKTLADIDNIDTLGDILALRSIIDGIKNDCMDDKRYK